MNGDEDSLQPVKYLGKVRSLYAHGMGVAIVSLILLIQIREEWNFSKEPVRLIWIRSKKGTRYNRCAISIHSFGLSIYEEIANGTFKNVWSNAIEDISYCVAEPLHKRLFAWIARSKHTNELECHVILCKTSKRARVLAELLAKSFHESYRYRQRQRLVKTPSLSTRCSVCDTIARQQQTTRTRPALSRSHSHDQTYQEDFERNRSHMPNDYERMSCHTPRSRALTRGFERNSMNSSRRSIDNDTTLADEESIKPVEYYRR